MSARRIAIAYCLALCSCFFACMSAVQAAATNAGQLSFSAVWFEAVQGTPFPGVKVLRTGGASGTATVECKTSNASAVAGVNYTAMSTTLHWADGDATPKVCAVQINNSDHFSGHLMLSVGLSAPTGATLGSTTSTLIEIFGNKDGGNLALQSPAYSVAQSAGSINVTVTRTGGSVGYAAVAYYTADKTAVAGVDFTYTYGELHWVNGDTTPRTITVPISKAKTFSGTKTFDFIIAGPFIALLSSPATAVVTITGSSTTAPAAGNVAFGAATYAVQQSRGAAVVTVARSGGTAGASSMSYATSNGTATAGQNFTAKTGTLTWADGDGTARSIVVPVATAAMNKSMNFQVALTKVSGAATLGAPNAATVTITPDASTSALSVSVSGNELIDAQGNGIQLRGVNVSGLEGPSFGNDPWRGQKPNFAAMKTWGINVVRLPLAESNWLGLCSITLNTGVTPAVYQAAIQAAASEANALGIYVILDLHWVAVPNLCPNGQNAMADTTYSAKFWSEVATAFKDNPAVMFELFNEPQGNYPPTTNDWNNYITGGLTGPQDTGAQQLLNAIRAAGATNVVLVDTLNYAATFGNNNPSKTGFNDNAPGFHLPTDTLSTPQLVAVQHYYNTATKFEQGANVVLNKNIPILLTEYGDVDGTTNDTTAVYGWADPGGRASQALTSGGSSFPGVGYVAWTWNFGYGGWSLISDSNGDLSGSPYAAAVKAHYRSRAGL